MNDSETELIYLSLNRNNITLLELDLSVKGIKYLIPINKLIHTIKSLLKEDSRKFLKVITKGDLKIIYVNHQSLSAFYITPFDSLELRLKIQGLLKFFELRYSQIIQIENNDTWLFEDFKEIIFSFLADEIIKEYYIVKTTNNTPKELIPGDFWPIISKINNKRTISAIANELKMDLKLLKNKIAYLKSKNLVSFLLYINLFDIPILLSKDIVKLFISTEHERLIVSKINKNRFKAIKLIDGKSSVIKLAENCMLSLSDMKRILKFLLMKGYIKFIPENLKWCLIFEDLYISYIQLIENFLGKLGINVFSSIIEKECNPLIKLIKISSNNIISFNLVKVHVKSNIDMSILELQESFLSPILKFFKYIKPTLDLISSNYYIDFKNEFIKTIELLKKNYGLKK